MADRFIPLILRGIGIVDQPSLCIIGAEPEPIRQKRPVRRVAIADVALHTGRVLPTNRFTMFIISFAIPLSALEDSARLLADIPDRAVVDEAGTACTPAVHLAVCLWITWLCGGFRWDKRLHRGRGRSANTQTQGQHPSQKSGQEDRMQVSYHKNPSLSLSYYEQDSIFCR